MSNGNDSPQGRLAKLLLVNYTLRRASYIVRAVAGIYVIYLVIQLFGQSGGSEERLSAAMIAAGVFMAVAGIYFVSGAAYALLKGIYSENVPSGQERPESETETETNAPVSVSEQSEPETGS